MRRQDITPGAVLAYRQYKDSSPVPVIVLGGITVVDADSSGRPTAMRAAGLVISAYGNRRHSGLKSGYAVLHLRTFGAESEGNRELGKQIEHWGQMSPIGHCPIPAEVFEAVNRAHQAIERGDLLRFDSAPRGWQWNKVNAAKLTGVYPAELVAFIADERAKVEQREASDRRAKALHDRVRAVSDKLDERIHLTGDYRSQVSISLTTLERLLGIETPES